MADAIATSEFDAEVQYLLDGWKRTALASFAQGVTIPDPGHGHDEISPVSVIGIPFDPDTAGDVTPFSPQDLRDIDDQDGTGFLAVELKPRGRPVVMSPGLIPEMREDHDVDILIVTPGRRGPALSMAYAGALAMLFRFASISSSSPAINIIRNLEPPPERPIPDGDDGDWRYDHLAIPMSRFYRPVGVTPPVVVFEPDVFEPDVFEGA